MNHVLAESRADLIVRSGFRLLRGLYLIELQWVDRAVPAGVLLMAPALQVVAHRARLNEVAADPAFKRWQMHFGTRVVGPGLASREAVLHKADEAREGRRLRRAVQLYGWLMLTSTESDRVMQQSLRNLQDLRREHYIRIDC